MVYVNNSTKVDLESFKLSASDLTAAQSLVDTYGVMLANTVGVIDADYYDNTNNEGHIWVKLTYPQQASISIDPFVVKAGDAICQAIIVPYFTVEDDAATAERVGGFGSTSR